ncbi:MAG: glutamyl-tRNA amidotransferase [Oscillospiraceae bacterium]|nr:glutamyl-tRNA amidotransferase [Oscillospiraceae bacterium]
MFENKRNDNRAMLSPKGRKRFRAFSILVLVLCMLMSLTVPAFAAPETGGDPISVVNNLSSFIFGLIRAVGIILLGWGIVQVGMSFSSHDPTQRSNGFLTLAGGVVITFAKEILNLIMGT